MVPFIYTHSRVERETETVSSREKDQDYRPNRKETTRGERMNQKQKETEELGKKKLHRRVRDGKEGSWTGLRGTQREVGAEQEEQARLGPGSPPSSMPAEWELTL